MAENEKSLVDALDGDMLSLSATEKALVRTVTYSEKNAEGQPVVKFILDPFSPDLDAAIAGCEYALQHNPTITSINLHRLNNLHLGTFSRTGKNKIVRKLSDEAQSSVYRSELIIAIDAHQEKIDAILEGNAEGSVRTYINKALGLMQFGLRVNLISNEQFEIYYARLADAKSSADALSKGGNITV